MLKENIIFRVVLTQIKYILYHLTTNKKIYNFIGYRTAIFLSSQIELNKV
jgi:hypothetical protein